MRIAHVVRSDSFGGVERYVGLVAPRLAARGCHVSVIGGDPEQMSRVSDTIEWRPASTTWRVAAELKRLGRLDVVHAHMTAAEAAAAVTKPFHRARLITTLHFASPRGSGSSRTAFRLLARFMDEEIAISDFVAKETGANLVLLNGVETADPGPPTRDRHVLVMQRLEREKRTDVALRAWSVCSLRNSGWRLLIAGRGSRLDELRRLSAELGISESVEWLGFVDHPPDLLARVGLLLAPAPGEPFGLTVVEAMARETPVVAADGGAHRETLGGDGWFFPVNDVAACARILDHAEHRDLAAYGKRLRSRQREFFDVEAHVDELMRIYQEPVE